MIWGFYGHTIRDVLRSQSDQLDTSKGKSQFEFIEDQKKINHLIDR
jgi:hypothetical protein